MTTRRHSSESAHAGQTVAVLVAGRDIRVLTDTGQLIRALTLDPTRDYRPQQ